MTSVDGVVAAFEHHLVQTCGLAATTRHRYRYEVRALLVARFGDGAVDLTALGPADVQGFVTTRARHLCPASANSVSNAVRALMRFLALEGIRAAGAAAAVPRAAVWRLSHVPSVLSDTELSAFLAAFDRTTALGRRDYAIAISLVTLGMRAGELAAITLDDIDWRTSTLSIPPCARVVVGRVERRTGGEKTG